MEETKNKILAYMQEKYNRSGWPFFSINDLIYLFGPDTKAACNALYREGAIKVREGVNSKICQYIPIN